MKDEDERWSKKIKKIKKWKRKLNDWKENKKIDVNVVCLPLKCIYSSKEKAWIKRWITIILNMFWIYVWFTHDPHNRVCWSWQKRANQISVTHFWFCFVFIVFFLRLLSVDSFFWLIGFSGKSLPTFNCRILAITWNFSTRKFSQLLSCNEPLQKKEHMQTHLKRLLFWRWKKMLVVLSVDV